MTSNLGNEWAGATEGPRSFEGSELKATEGPRLLNLRDGREESFVCYFRTLNID